jgi:2-polyprenyl-3-methyl-5-hydroxy-6-metoxy-1,4-benzoquinol methylase
MNKMPLGPHPDFPSCTVVQEGDFCYTDPYPSNEQLTEYYNSTYRAVRQEAPTSDYLKFMRARAKVQAQFIRQGSGKTRFATVLDIGSGCGTLLAELQNDADYLEGWEPDVAMSEYANDHFTSSQTKFTSDLFIPGKTEQKFDLITMSHVLEHVPFPRDFLAKLRTHHLSQGGWIFIEVPNDPAWWVKIQIEKDFKGLGHINYFTSISLESIFINSGYHPHSFRTCGADITHFVKQRLARESLLSKVLRKLKIPMEASPPDYSSHSGYTNGIYLQELASSGVVRSQ